jgi:hypothetical protein
MACLGIPPSRMEPETNSGASHLTCETETNFNLTMSSATIHMRIDFCVSELNMSIDAKMRERDVIYQ